jgi:hypothetical protein
MNNQAISIILLGRNAITDELSYFLKAACYIELTESILTKMAKRFQTTTSQLLILIEFVCMEGQSNGN